MMRKNPDKLSAIHKAREIVKELCIEDASHIDIASIAFQRGAIVKEEPMKGADGRFAALGSKGLTHLLHQLLNSSFKSAY